MPLRFLLRDFFFSFGHGVGDKSLDAEGVGGRIVHRGTEGTVLGSLGRTLDGVKRLRGIVVRRSRTGAYGGKAKDLA